MKKIHYKDNVWTLGAPAFEFNFGTKRIEPSWYKPWGKVTYKAVSVASLARQFKCGWVYKGKRYELTAARGFPCDSTSSPLVVQWLLRQDNFLGVSTLAASPTHDAIFGCMGQIPIKGKPGEFVEFTMDEANEIFDIMNDACHMGETVSEIMQLGVDYGGHDAWTEPGKQERSQKFVTIEVFDVT